MSFAVRCEVPYKRLISDFQDLEICDEEDIIRLESDSAACSDNKSDLELDIFAEEDSITGFGNFDNKDTKEEIVKLIECIDLTGDDQSSSLENDENHDLKFGVQPKVNFQPVTTIQESARNSKSLENLDDPTSSVKMKGLSLDGRPVIGKRYWALSPRDDGSGKVDLSEPFQGDELDNMRDSGIEFEKCRNYSPKEIRPRSSAYVTSETRKRSATDLSSDRRGRSSSRTNSPRKKRPTTSSSSSSSNSSVGRHKRSWRSSANLSRERQKRSLTNSPRRREHRSSSYSSRESRRRSATCSPRKRRRRSASYSPRERRQRSSSISPRERQRRSSSISLRERRQRSASDSPRGRRKRSSSNASKERDRRNGSRHSSRSKYRRRSPIVRVRRTLVFDQGLDDLNNVRKPSRNYWSSRNYYERNNYSRSRRSFSRPRRSRSRYRSRSRSTATRRR